MSKRLVLPRIGRGDDVVEYLNRLATAIEQQASTAPSGRPYTVTNGVTTRALNVSTATATDAAKVLGSLIVDLQAGSAIG